MKLERCHQHNSLLQNSEYVRVNYSNCYCNLGVDKEKCTVLLAGDKPNKLLLDENVCQNPKDCKSI